MLNLVSVLVVVISFLVVSLVVGFKGLKIFKQDCFSRNFKVLVYCEYIVLAIAANGFIFLTLLYQITVKDIPLFDVIFIYAIVPLTIFNGAVYFIMLQYIEALRDKNKFYSIRYFTVKYMTAFRKLSYIKLWSKYYVFNSEENILFIKNKFNGELDLRYVGYKIKKPSEFAYCFANEFKGMIDEEGWEVINNQELFKPKNIVSRKKRMIKFYNSNFEVIIMAVMLISFVILMGIAI